MSTKNTFKSIVKYFRELSIVVAGIAITFTLSNRINVQHEKKDLQQYMSAVKLELEDNLQIVQDQFEFYNRTGKFAKYLLFNNPKNVHADSLKKYDDIKKNIFYMTYQASAFEMLKSSGTMRLVKDKNLLKSIIDCYSLMERAKIYSDYYMTLKQNVFFNELIEYGIAEGIRDFDIRDPKYKRLYNFLAMYTGGEGNFRSCAAKIKETLPLFPQEE